MSTRSQIIRENSDGTYTGAYIHCDGYPSVRGLECLAAKQEGLFSGFIDYIIERDDHDEYDYDTYDDIIKHVRASDLEWVYILHTDGTWTVLDVRIQSHPEKLCFSNTVDEITGSDSMLKNLIIEDSDSCTEDHFNEMLSEECAYARKTYRKSDVHE